LTWMKSTSNINEIGNKSIHSKHQIRLQEAEGSRFLQAKLDDQLFIDHLLFQEFIDVDQHRDAERLIFLASRCGSFAKAPSFNSIRTETAKSKDMLSNPLVKLGNQLKWIKKRHGDRGLKVVTNHVILDQWTDCLDTIKFLGIVLDKKRPARKERIT